MIAVLALIAGVVLGVVLDPTVPAALQPYLPIAVVAALDAVFGGVRAKLDGIFDDKQFVISFISNVLVAGADRLPRRPARRRRAALHRRRRRARRADLRQRGGDPPPPVPGVRFPERIGQDTMTDEHRETGTGWPDPESAGPAEAVTPEVAGPGSVALPTADASPPPTRRPEPTAAGREAAPRRAGERGAGGPGTRRPRGRDAAAAGGEPAVPARPVPDPDGTPRPDETSHRPTPAPVPAAAAVAGSAPPTLMIAVLLALLGFTLVVQLRSNVADPASPRRAQEDLVRILSDLEAREERLQQRHRRPGGEPAAAQPPARGPGGGARRRPQRAGRRAGHPRRHAAGPRAGAGRSASIDGPDGSRPRPCSTRCRSCAAPAPRRCRSPAPTARVRIVASTYFVDAEGGGSSSTGSG